MLSQSKLKLIHSLDSKKGRRENGLFVAEGPKAVGDLLAVMPARLVVAVKGWLEKNPQLPKETEVVEVSEAELKKASFLQHPQQVLALFRLPEHINVAPEDLTCKLSLALDGVQDPGNVGTIIRLADWFGIETVVCSQETADAFSPKVVQATMGSIARVRTAYVDLPAFIRQLPSSFPVYGTLLDGENIYEKQLTSEGLIVMGNEGKGISQAVRPLVNERLLIPNWPPGRATAESLNVAIATAITCAEFRRKSIQK